MATSLGAPAPAAPTPLAVAGAHTRTEQTEPESGVPWFLYAVVLAATSVIVGVIWDISWHMTVGRDTLWSPPHMATYFAAIVVGISCGSVALRTTFRGTAADRARAVSFWGFRAPLGAWICVWGAFAMLTSAPFDDWWHNAYGLDVKIISPPHSLLALGMFAIVLGALTMCLAWQNRASAGARRRLGRMFLYSAGLLLAMIAVFATEYTWRGGQHGTTFYKVVSMAFPLVLVGAARAGRSRWSATTVAAVYMGVFIAMGWILPLFEGSPRLGPIYRPLTHFAAMEFPLLLIAPALAIDWIMQRGGHESTPGRDWLLAPMLAIAFLAAFMVVQWPFADFLHSSAARNWVFFADRNFSYSTSPTSRYGTYQFWAPAADRQLATWAVAIPMALLYGSISARVGLAWGRWMTKVQR